MAEEQKEIIVETPPEPIVENPVVEPAEIVVKLPEPTPWESLGEFDAIKAELEELRGFKEKVKDVPLEKVEFLKQGGDPIENLKKYQELFEKDYEKVPEFEIVKSHLMAQGKSEKQASLILSQYEDMDEELDEDYKERKELFDSYVKEARGYFIANQNSERERYNQVMDIGAPETLKKFVEQPIDAKLTVGGQVSSTYTVPKEYVEEAKSLMLTLPQMKNVKPEEYQQTLEGILWLNSEIREKMLAATVQEAIRQTEEKYRVLLEAQTKEHKAKLLELSGVTTQKAPEVVNQINNGVKRSVPNITI